jgi:hypothetical protein
MPVDAIEDAPPDTRTAMRGNGDDGLAHLEGAASRVRQALAAHYLRDFATIVEIGGFLNPVSDHLVHDPSTVWVVDPKIASLETDLLHGRRCALRHIAAKYQAVDFTALPRPYALVMLGYSMKAYGSKEALDPVLLSLVDNADRVILEWARALRRATAQIPALVSRPGLRRTVAIDYRLEDGVIETSPYADRTLVVLDRVAQAG